GDLTGHARCVGQQAPVSLFDVEWRVRRERRRKSRECKARTADRLVVRRRRHDWNGEHGREKRTKEQSLTPHVSSPKCCDARNGPRRPSGLPLYRPELRADRLGRQGLALTVPQAQRWACGVLSFPPRCSVQLPDWLDLQHTVIRALARVVRRDQKV